MGLFDIFKKKKEHIPTNQVLLAMALFNDNEAYDINKIVEHLKSFWNLDVKTDEDLDNETSVFEINGLNVAVALMPAPVPLNEIKEVASYNFHWETAYDELKDHTRHAIISVLQGNQTILDSYLILSKLICSVFITSNCIGIYQGMTTQLFSKDYYLSFVDDIKLNNAISPLWVYVGIRQETEGVSLYTYGLKNFGKLELEIIKSKQNTDDLYDFIYNISDYVINRNITFKNAETVGYTAEQKILLSISKGVYIDGQTIKMKI